jgi:hypothetical protein
MPPNNSFKPNLLRYTNSMAEKACHAVGSATQVGLTQALGACQATWFGLPFFQHLARIRHSGICAPVVLSSVAVRLALQGFGR